MPNILAALIEIIKPAETGLFAVGVAWVAYRLNRNQARQQKEAEFAERQIKEFYSPLIGLRKQILTLSALRQDVSLACNSAWDDIIQAYPDHEERKKYFDIERHIECENERFKNQILPLYDRMQAIFTENYWLADKSTRCWLEEFSRFVMLWHRHLEKTLPREAMRHLDINHREENLEPFYRGLERELDHFRNVAAGIKPQREPFALRWRKRMARRREPVTMIEVTDTV